MNKIKGTPELSHALMDEFIEVAKRSRLDTATVGHALTMALLSFVVSNSGGSEEKAWRGMDLIVDAMVAVMKRYAATMKRYES